MIDLDTLEFDLFCGIFSKRCVSSFAAEAVSELSPKSRANETYPLQNDLKSVFGLYNSTHVPSIENDNGFFTLYSSLKELKAHEITLEPHDYRTTGSFYTQINNIKQYFNGKIDQIPRLSGVIDRIKPDMAFAELIERTFDEHGEVKDGASHALASIRGSIRDVRRKVQHTLHGIFSGGNASKFIQEQVVVLRHGRYTIPCKTNFSQYINGIIHDRSASGQTVYVEPASVVSLNNGLQEHILAESEEVARILAMLLSTFKDGLPQLRSTVEAYKYLAFLMETAVFYSRYEYTFPEFTDEIVFRQVHHPLLLLNKGDESVPLDVSLPKEQNLIVVSGPNTGGKTASLKSVGLNHIIGMCGLPVFGKSAKLIFFDSIQADIGDKQSLVMDLSTFSSHMTNINRIITDIQGCGLCLFDELGTGTDPREGAALALAVLDYLKDKGAKVIITTHFSEVKSYAFERHDAKMYAVDFDYNTFTPTYSLLEGVSGSSDPVIIAERLGFPKDVISDAKNRIAEMKTSTEAVFEELNLMKAEAEHTKRVLAERERELAEKEAKVEAGQAELREKLSKRELDLLENTLALYQKGKRLAESKIKEAPEKIADEIKVITDKIKQIKAGQKPVKEVAAGDLIYLDKYSKIAKILSLDNSHAQVDLEGIKVKISRQDLVGRKVEDTKPKKVKVSAGGSSQGRSELVLVGKRVEEALDLLDKYIDNSQLSGYDKVYIVHGRGSGQLRQAVQDYLRSSGRIKRCYTAASEEGGHAVTVVEL